LSITLATQRGDAMAGARHPWGRNRDAITKGVGGIEGPTLVSPVPAGYAGRRRTALDLEDIIVISF